MAKLAISVAAFCLVSPGMGVSVPPRYTRLISALPQSCSEESSLGSTLTKKLKGEIHHGEIATLRKLDQLPYDCLARVLSRTTPRDVCVSCAVSRTFQSAANMDEIWQGFLPSDYASFLSHAEEPIENASNKELYFRLCDHPVPIYGGKMAFGLEKSRGAKCFTISARGMHISFIDSMTYWKWVRLSNSRFKEAAQMVYNGQWRSYLSLSGRIASTMLSSDNTYVAYLIYRLGGSVNTGSSLLKSTIEINTMMTPNGTLCLVPKFEVPRTEKKSLEMSEQGIKWSQARKDGWREVEIGEFYIKRGQDEKVKMKLEKADRVPISRICILGIDIRPKGRRRMICHA